jgi:hypothetical protein
VKKFVIFLFLVTILIPNTQAQWEEKNVFKFNIYSMVGFRPAYQFGYERRITNNFAINTELGYMTFFTPFAFRMSNSLSGVKWLTDLRVYLKDDPNKRRRNYLAWETEIRSFGLVSEMNVQIQNGAYSERRMVRNSFLTLGNNLKYGTIIPFDNSNIFLEVSIFAGVRYTQREYKLNEGESISQFDDGFFFIRYPIVLPNLGASILLGFGK